VTCAIPLPLASPGSVAHLSLAVGRVDVLGAAKREQSTKLTRASAAITELLPQMHRPDSLTPMTFASVNLLVFALRRTREGRGRRPRGSAHTSSATGANL
jgi:hypothetical protein